MIFIGIIYVKEQNPYGVFSSNIFRSKKFNSIYIKKLIHNLSPTPSQKSEP